MTNIATSGYSEFIRQTLDSGRFGRKTQSADYSAAGSFGSVIRNIRYDDSVLERMESKRSSSERWTDTSLYTLDVNTPEGYKVNRAALAKVRERLKEEGIDADSRTPTHEITDEQMEWLGSRYDLEFLSICSFTHEEYGNFMLDLAYLNVFSLDEVENMYGVMPFNSNHKGYLYKMDTGDGLSGYVNAFGGPESYDDEDDLYTRLIMEYIKIKYTGRTESEYEQMSKDFAAQRMERMMVIENFFARVSENMESNNAAVSKPVIEDASGKLMDDFGNVLEGEKTSGKFPSPSSGKSENDVRIPDKWKIGWGAENSLGWGVDIAVEFMRVELGINVSEREPTHEITDEQKDWLVSRHDLDTIQNYGINTLEMQNFLADLVYLNVYSPDEAKNLTLVSFPEHTSRVGKLDNVSEGRIFHTNEGNFADLVAGAIDIQRSIIDYIREKYNDPVRSEEDDLIYIQKASDFLANKQECYNVLLGFFE